MVQRAQVRFYDVTSGDGTGLRAWTNDAAGPNVVVSNGLGTNAYVWPTLLQPDSGFRVVGWNHRGTGGSARPGNGRLGVDAHLDDLLSVMDEAEMDSAVIVGWSIGVNVAFELAAEHPERVRGVLAIAGVPGATFSTMLEPLRVPPLAAEQIMLNAARAVTVAGHAAAPVTSRLPWSPLTVDLLKRAGIFSRRADPALVEQWLREFFTTHPAWYAKLAVAAAEHDEVALSRVDTPSTLIAASHDLLAGPSAMRSAADRIAGARFRHVRGTHFIPMERPELVIDELAELMARVES